MAVDPASLAVKAVLMAAQMALTMTQKIEGPRLDSRDVTTADYGTPLIYFWGKRRLDGVPIIWAEKLREKKTTSKTKGGKYSDYKYFGTFAVAIADHEIDAVTRIWMDKHLVFDLTRAGPISAVGGFFLGPVGAAVKLAQGKNMRVYLGTEDQGIDPRYEAWCEDRYGPDTATAYKGVSYIVFEDIPLEKFGNRIPQISVEAVNDSSTNYLWEAEAISPEASLLLFSPDYSRFYADRSIWDTATQTRMIDTPITPHNLDLNGGFWRLTDGLGTGGGPFLTYYSLDGQSASEPLIAPNPAGDILTTLNDDVVILTPFALVSDVVQYVAGAFIEELDVGFAVCSIGTDSAGNVWLAGRPFSVSEIHLYCFSGLRSGESHSFSTSSINDVRLWINSSDEFVLEQNGNLHRLASDFTPLQSASITGSGTFSHVHLSDRVYRTESAGVYEYDISNLTEIRNIQESLWVGAPGNMTSARYEPVTHSIVALTNDNIVWRYLDRVGSDGTLLANVVSDVAVRCGLADVDVDDLLQTVPGYSVTQGSGKDQISPLLDIHDVDVRPHDFSVQFITRGNASLGTIDVGEFASDETRYTISVTQDTDIPRQIMLSFADAEKDQQTNTVIFQRPLDAADTVRTQAIDMSTYVDEPSNAQKLVDRYGRRKWNGRENISHGLTAQYLKLEPADVYTLTLDDVVHTARLEKLTISQGRLNVEWVRDFPSLNAFGTGEGSSMDGRDVDVIYIPSPTKGFVLDIPLVQDSHDLTVPQVYYAAGNYGAGNWPGASLYQADADGDEYFPWNGVDVADKAVWGYATDELADSDPWLWDRGNTVNVGVKGTLTSTTEAAIDANPLTNLAYLGGELINFVTATLEADGTYTLSGFKRGRRGTEYACAEHAAGDEFVLVSSLARDGFGLSDVGLELEFKAQTVGRDLESAAVIEVDFDGATLMPYAPARIIWTTDGTDMFGEIIRRTRVGGAWVGGSTIPLSEASEAYEVDIMDGDDVLRTITVTGTNVFTYTAAEISADGNTVGVPPAFNAYQMSDAVGRGFALAA